MKPLDTFFVRPHLPESLESLWKLAYNLRWTWQPEATQLFMNMSPELWQETENNPVAQLGEMSPEKLAELNQDPSYQYRVKRQDASLDNYMDSTSTWFETSYADELGGPIAAYFSAEFGLADCVPIFSGGLGILAGDHLKSSSDMGIPLVAIGLMYQHGYFRQYLSPDGWQQESYPISDFYNMPVKQVFKEDGAPVEVEIPMEGRTIRANVWMLQAGRNKLYLLDTNHQANGPEDQGITNHLYGGDQEMRIRQEIVLGIGGVRMLEVLGFKPRVYHSNEGHAAFLTLERIKQIMTQESVPFDVAVEAVRSQVVFTTHTPVPAGIDVFPQELVRKYFSSYVNELGISIEDLLAAGQESAHKTGFNMAVLALHFSSFANGVSKLHGEVSRKMWCGLWKGLEEKDVPIGHVTNGIHVPSWVSPELSLLFDRYLGPGWREDPLEGKSWERMDNIPLDELWQTHERRRERLVRFARTRYAEQLTNQGASPKRISAAAEVLNPEALTIGFARRFAPYKRATLLLSDVERLLKMITNKDRPVQFIFAGKAHPRDHFGKDLVQTIVQFSKRPEVNGRFIFLEDYDIEVARYLVQGVDVWLNNPRPPKEASGTSGMKAVSNGALHFSTLDGWWAEVEDEGIGWTIGRGEEYDADQHAYQDEVEANILYDLLETELIPTFYNRDSNGLPKGWIKMMRRSMQLLCPVFNSNRMVREYANKYYVPAARLYDRMVDNNLAAARGLAAWRGKMQAHWSDLHVSRVDVKLDQEPSSGTQASFELDLYPGQQIKPEDLKVQLIWGRVAPDHKLIQQTAEDMTVHKSYEDGKVTFKHSCALSKAGRLGYAVRILPNHKDLPDPAQLRLVKVVEAK
jgi:glycogen phosphorylase